MGFTWKQIMEYDSEIHWISRKYSGDPDLAEDVAQEVMLRLFEDKRLKISNFDPTKKDAAIRQTIRNKVIKVLRSRKVGRWDMDSLEKLKDLGYQIDTSGDLIQDPAFIKKWSSSDPDNHDDER